MSQTQQVRGVATKIVRPDPHTIRVLYHDTCVAQLTTHADGTREVRLNHGGWKTATTKARMNQFANEFCGGAFSVGQKRGEWFLYFHGAAESHIVYHNQTITFTL